MTATMLDDEQRTALEVARGLAEAGVPIFLARPDIDAGGQWRPDGGHNGCGYWFPGEWEQTLADPAVLDRWRPGVAVCAVMGVIVDGLDVDPRSGGDTSRRELEAAGAWPQSLGQQSTPSGGTHDLVNLLGVHSLDSTLPGLDVKAGHERQGSGFLFLAPTVKLSKSTGELGQYRWTVEPHLDDLDPADDSGALLAERIVNLRTAEDVEVEVPHEAFDAMPDEHRAAVRRYLDAAVRGMAADLEDALDWPEGYVHRRHENDPGRGWQKLLADTCNRLGRLARAEWTPWSLDDARKHLERIVPRRIDDAVGRDSTWKAQNKRRTPAPFPAQLAGLAALDQLIETATAAAGTPPPPDPITLDAAHVVFRRWLGPTYDLTALDAVLAAAAVEQLDGDPVWLLIVSGSGNAKTETVGALAGAGAHVTSTVTSEGALLSATSAKDKTKDATGGLLRKIGDRGLLVIKDFTSILSMNRDARAGVLAAMREVYDGRWERNVGTDGGKTLTWTGRVALVGAVTTAYDSAHGVIASMGDRFALVRVDSNLGRLEAGRQALRNVGHEEQMRAELAEAAGAVLAGVDPGRAALTDDDMLLLLGAADLVTLARTAVERDYRGDVIEAHQPEAPTRFAKMLGQLVRGVLALGGTHDTALVVAMRVAGDSVPPLRLLLLADLLDTPDASTSEVTKRVQRPRSTVDRGLQELHLLGLVVVRDTGQGGGGWRYSIADGVDTEALGGIVTRNVTTPGYRVKEERTSRSEEVRLPTDISGDAPPACLDCGQPLLLRRPGRALCERCRLATDDRAAS